tara:strand:- start:226 stop:1452 length:1227 start_codon:yes stop_codon:yes gene_type:complete
MYRFLTFLLFFPSITFGLYSSEVFPWGVIFSAFYLRHITKEMLMIIILMGISCSFVILTNIFYEGLLNTDVIRSLAAYMNFLLMSQTLLILGQKRAFEITLLSRNIFWLLIIIGFIQIIGSDILGSFIQFFVPRGEGNALVEINRGVTLLATEPARAGVELTLIYLIYRISQTHSNKHILIDLFVIIFQALIIKSASAMAFTIGAFGIMHFRFNTRLFTIVTTTIFAISLIFFVVYILPEMGGRAGDVVLFLKDTDLASDAIFYIANESGNRLIALYSFIISGFYSPFGYGIGSWTYSSIIAFNESGLDYRDFRFFDVVGNGQLIAFRGPGVISNLMLDLGLFGTILIFYLFRKMMLRYAEFSDFSKKAFWIFLFKIAFFGSPGNPIVFIFFMVVFLTTAQKNKSIYT